LSAEDWYRRHVGGGAPSSPPQARYAPPPIPQAYQPPPGYQLVPVQQPQPQQPYYGDQTDQYLATLGVGTPGHANPWAEAPPPPIDTTRIPKGTVNPANFLQMAAFWRGGSGRKAAQHCPRCDGVVFRRFEGTREAAPLCTSCGWNGMWDQGEHSHVA
jgi:hypothetical protein